MFDTPDQLTRRDVLQRGLFGTALLPWASGLRLDPLAAEREDTVLVVLQLTGGNDGLNTVVPHRQDAYYRLRPNLGLAARNLHALDDDHGLHPSMGGLGELYREGRLAVIQGVGSPNPDLSHFRSLEVWHGGDPYGPAPETGWLGRMADALAQGRPGSTPALALDAGDLPLSMRGRELTPPTVRDPKGLRLHQASKSFAEARDRLCRAQGGGSDLEHLRRVARSTYATAERMAALTAQPSPVEYPEHDLGKRLRLVAQLLRGGFGTRIFHLSHDGFDTHARQAVVHANLLSQVSSALAAFQRDLDSDGTGQRVLTLAFSEFGRRVAENASKGTDHGQAAPVFLLGGRVQGGLHGQAPQLDELQAGDVVSSFDFRRLYTGLVQDWMGLQVPVLEFGVEPEVFWS